MAAQLQAEIDRIKAGEDGAYLNICKMDNLTKDPELFGAVITGLRVQATTDQKSETVPRPPVHFRLFFQLQPRAGIRKDVRSVEIDSTSLDIAQDSNGNQPTQLKITLRQYDMSSASVSFLAHSGDLVTIGKGTAPGELRVCDLIALLITKKRYRYRLDRKSGSGCRWFCETLLQDLRDKRWSIPGSPVQDVVDRIRRNRSWEFVDLPLDAPKGQFY